jgi:hypothetical protein
MLEAHSKGRHHSRVHRPQPSRHKEELVGSRPENGKKRESSQEDEKARRKELTGKNSLFVFPSSCLLVISAFSERELAKEICESAM